MSSIVQRYVTVIGLCATLAPRGFQAQEAQPDSASRALAVLVGAGDVARCESDGDEVTAALLDSIVGEAAVPTVVFTLGDNAYGRGTEEKFRECYEPSWGRFKSITRPVPGNHDYKNGFMWFVLGGHAGPYFDHFNAFRGQAGDRGDGWYHYQHGGWDVYALNTNEGRRVEPASRQWEWLQSELAHRTNRCSVAYMHHPRFSTSRHGDNDRMRDVWELLAQHGIDIFIAGHDHNYQRFDPQDPDGRPSEIGIRQFVVGTGGTYLVTRNQGTSGVLARWTAVHHGVLKLTLRADAYDWEFIVENGAVWDSGSSVCQNTRHSF
ncbi:MAG: metallophosphoesterase [Gemmatimonadota bacterium]|nr:MAG: metallophosphoesterase [Gemmatimonadota bacterium]